MSRIYLGAAFVALAVVSCAGMREQSFEDFVARSEQSLRSEGWAALVRGRQFPLSLWLERSVTHPEPHNRAPLFLPGIESLSVREVAELRGWKGGRRLFLPDASEIEAAALRALVATPRPWDELFLDGLAHLDSVRAEILVRAAPSRLSLRGLRSLAPEVARSLARLDGSLDLSGLTALGLDLARELAAYDAFAEMTGLSLDGLEALDPSVAEQIGGLRCWLLSLCGITSLSVAEIRALAFRKRPYLRMNGIRELSSQQAQAMAESWDVKFLELRGMRGVDSEVQEILRSAFAAVTFAPDSGR